MDDYIVGPLEEWQCTRRMSRSRGERTDGRERKRLGVRGENPPTVIRSMMEKMWCLHYEWWRCAAIKMIFMLLSPLSATSAYNFDETHPLINFYIFNLDDGMRPRTPKPVLICSPHFYSSRVRTINILSNWNVCAPGTRRQTPSAPSGSEPSRQRAKATNTGTYGFMCNWIPIPKKQKNFNYFLASSLDWTRSFACTLILLYFSLIQSIRYPFMRVASKRIRSRTSRTLTKWRCSDVQCAFFETV